MQLNEKIKIFQKEGFDKILVITDFDGTLTYGYNKDGSRTDNSFSVFRNHNYFPQEYEKKADELYDYYYPIEIDHSISENIRKEKMYEWWSKHIELITTQAGITKEIIFDIVENDYVKLRNGNLEFFKICENRKIPIIIFSAGEGNLIEEILKGKSLLTSNVELVSNFYKWENGKISDIIGEIIHSMNKDMHGFSHLKNYNDIVKRKNVILIGDHLGDLKMVSGFEYDNVIKIGFLNVKNNLEMKNKYLEEFDLVIEEDSDFSKINELLKEVLENE